MKKIAVGILAHVDAGKTTLSEGLLYSAGAVDSLGRVDKRDAFFDSHSIERERGITIFSKQAIFCYGDSEITLIDTPGHIDFSTDPIEEAYYLEVSSPGIERELRTDEHIDYCVGADVEVRLYAPVNGSKVFRGELLPLAENGAVEILAGEQKLTFERASVAKIKTVFEF